MSRLLTIILVYVIFLNQTEAQIGTNSPYSRFGLGDFQHNISPVFNAFGGASIAFEDSRIINFNNPATYTKFTSNTFLFSTGGWNQTTQIHNKNGEQIANSTSLSHFVFGFPLSKKIGASAGMIPFSSIGYDILVRDSEYNAEMNYYGDGGISEIYFGTAYQFIDVFSIGLNASYLFGSLNRRKKLVFDDDNFLHSRSNNKINLKGYYYELGILYSKSLNQNDKFSLAIKTNNNSNISAKKSEIIESFEFSGLLEVPIDTIKFSNELGEVIFPRNISTGVTYKNNKWLLIAEYNTQNWADYIMFDETDNLVSSMSIAGGIQFTPNYNSINKYYKRMDYRFGACYRDIPLQFEENQLKEISVSFGFGIPIKKSKTKYDVSCTLGHRGTTQDNLIKEQFVRIGLSISYDAIWFVKRKYD
tara:strand:+ start:118 stop:1368 length:1251 start_codon:yes stop_codon:yes gene_type:complete